MRWMPVLGSKIYEVSDTGLVKRIEHISQNKRYGDQKLSERFLKLIKNQDGYHRVKIGGRLVFAHVLVLEAFICPRPEKMQCCHNNGIPDDNRLVNLRWDTPKNNVHDRKFHGTYQYGEKNPNSKHWRKMRIEDM